MSYDESCSVRGVFVSALRVEGAGPDTLYQGKQIKVVVGFTTGGFYDRWARLLSRYMPKHIPGSPESGENLEKLVSKTMNQPADVIARVKKLLGNQLIKPFSMVIFAL